MQKLLIIIGCIFLASAVQGQSFQKGNSAANIGVGIGTSLGGLGKARPAISASFDHGLWDMAGPGVISLGGYIGNTGFKYTDMGYTAKWNYYVIGVRGAYHYNGFTQTPKLDLYAGAMLGYNLVKYSTDGTSQDLSTNYGNGIGLSGFLGARWFFKESLAAFTELGYGVSNLNVGLSFKL